MTTYGASFLAARLLAIVLGVDGLQALVFNAAEPLTRGQFEAFDIVRLASPAVAVLIAIIVWRAAGSFADRVDMARLTRDFDLDDEHDEDAAIDATQTPVFVSTERRPAARRDPARLVPVAVALIGVWLSANSIGPLLHGVGELALQSALNPASNSLFEGAPDFSAQLRWRNVLWVAVSGAQFAVGAWLLLQRFRVAAFLMRAERPPDVDDVDDDEFEEDA